MKSIKNRKIIIPFILVGAALVLSACAVKTSTTTTSNTNIPLANLNTNSSPANVNTNSSTNSSNSNANINSNVNTSNKTVLQGNICNVFTSDYVTTILGMNVVKTQAKTDTGVTACLYYTVDSTTSPKFIEIAVENYNVANIKQGYVQVGTTTRTDPALGASDFVGLRTDNSIRGIYLVMNPSKIVTVSSDTPSTQPVADNAMVQFAAKLETRLADYQ